MTSIRGRLRPVFTLLLASLARAWHRSFRESVAPEFFEAQPAGFAGTFNFVPTLSAAGSLPIWARLAS